MIISLKNFVCRLCVVTVATFLGIMSVGAQTPAASSDLVVPIPTVPEELTRLDERCNYLVENFWKHASLKSAFSSLDKMDATFGQFLAFTPYADAKVVHGAIEELITGVEKTDAKNLIKLARMAEKWTGSDTSEYASEELFYPFVKAVSTSKKVKDPEKARFQALYRKLNNSRLGAQVADFSFTCPDGSIGKLSDLTTPSVLLIFYEPDCIDCRLAKARLSSDYVLPALVKGGALSVVAIYPGEADEDWKTDADSMPDGWIVGAAPDIDLDFTITQQPEIYFLDSDRNVAAKNIQVDNAIAAFRSLIESQMSGNGQRGNDNSSTEADK